MYSLSRIGRQPIRLLGAHKYFATTAESLSEVVINAGPSAGGQTFSELTGKITPNTLKAIIEAPFNFQDKPMSAVQSRILPMLPHLANVYDAKAPTEMPRDLLVKARTGTGKTLAFLVPAVESRLRSIDEFGLKAVKDSGLVNDKTLETRARRIFQKEHVGSLIITPTRELAMQIAEEALKLTKHHENLQVRLFIGGINKKIQMRDFVKGTRDIVVATPGRLRDLMVSEPEVCRGLSKTRILILDEADTMLDMGFRDDLDFITDRLPPAPDRQTFLFSATVSPAIQQIARTTLHKNHAFIDCVDKGDSPVHAHIPQYFTVLPSSADQIPHILKLIAHDQLENPGRSKIMLFLPTTKLTQLFATLLRELAPVTTPAAEHTKVYEIHSKRTQESRTHTSDNFRADTRGATVLVTSDVSARGVDYPGVTRVIQVGIPASYEQYIHRVGRTGRGSAKTQGRSDFVLLPFEQGFVTWQLTDIPMRPLTITELDAQVEQLAAAYDAKPTPLPEPPTPPPRSALMGKKMNLASRIKPRDHPENITARLLGLPVALSNLLAKVDPTAVGETFASMLGYYMPKTGELRIQKEVMIEGCKEWTVDACKLPRPPYISPQFLAKLGFHDGRTKRFGNMVQEDWRVKMDKGRRKDYGYNMPASDPWAENAEEYRSTTYSPKGMTPRFTNKVNKSSSSMRSRR